MKAAIPLIPIAVGFVIAGCSSEQRTSDQRRVDAIELIEKHYLGHSNPFMVRQARESLNALRSATTKSLKVPRITFAGLTRTETPTLVVTWIEDSPSVDAVEYRLAGAGASSLPIDAEQKAELKAQAMWTVQFIKTQKFESDSEIARSLAAVGGVPSIEVRLRTLKEPDTDWFRVWIWPSDVER